MTPELSHNLSTSPERPFVLRLHRQGEDAAGRFVPHATVEIAPFLRTSGLLAWLPAEEVRSLLALLSFVTSGGEIHPTVPELTVALQLSPLRVQQRMRRLAALSWQGKPLVQELRRESGLHAWTPAPRLFATLPAVPLQAAPASAPPTTGREGILTQNRALYARPRQEVEADIARRNGWSPPPPDTLLTQAVMSHPDLSPEANELRPRLLAAGLKALQADMLLARFEPARIRRQLDWLPLRNARNPAAFLLAAVEKDFAAPSGSEPLGAKPDRP